MEDGSNTWVPATCRETGMEFWLGPWVQTWPAQAFGEWTSGMKIFVSSSLLLCLSNVQANLKEKKLSFERSHGNRFNDAANRNAIMKGGFLFPSISWHLKLYLLTAQHTLQVTGSQVGIN